MYLRYPLSYQDVADLLDERGLDVDRSTIFRWVQKFEPELTKRMVRHLQRASLNWHVPSQALLRNILPVTLGDCNLPIQAKYRRIGCASKTCFLKVHTRTCTMNGPIATCGLEYYPSYPAGR